MTDRRLSSQRLAAAWTASGVTARRRSGQLFTFSTLEPVGISGVNSAGRPIYSLANVVTNPDASKFTTHSTASRWRAKLGLRWLF